MGDGGEEELPQDKTSEATKVQMQLISGHHFVACSLCSPEMKRYKTCLVSYRYGASRAI